jgi:hypothetical protein
MSKKFAGKIVVVAGGYLNFTHGKGFGLFDSVRYGPWLARS